MFRLAKWIACGEVESPIITKKCTLKKPKTASIKIIGLGMFELFINGKKVSDDLFTPVFSDYQKRDLSTASYPINDIMTHRMYYLCYDIATYLVDGENNIEVQLANGWYRQKERQAEGALHFGEELKAIFEISVLTEDGEKIIFSDGTETYRLSHIVYNNLFVGEVHDMRLLSSNKGDEKQVNILPSVDTIYEEQKCPSDKIIRYIKPTLLNKEDGGAVFDVGENISGWVEFSAILAAGAKITVRHAEDINDDYSLDFASTGSKHTCASGVKQIQADTYISDGNKHCYHPQFTYHAFRYFEVEGIDKNIEDVQVAVIHTAIEKAASFFSSDETLNWMFDSYIRTQLNNMHQGVTMDCPHREKLGYTGDGQVTAELAMLTLDSKDFYKKWAQDIFDCQDIDNGHVQHTAPFMGGGGGPGGWGSAVVVLPYQYYKNYGDKDSLQKALPHIEKWISYMKSRSDNYLVIREEEGGWCLGDWASIEKMSIPEPFVNTCLFIKSLSYVLECYSILGLTDDKNHVEYIEKAKASLLQTYFNNETESFEKAVQGADAFALDIGLGTKKTLENLVARYTRLQYFDTGFLGTDVLIDVLFKKGQENLAFDLLTSEKMGSYAYMKNNGATTLWEYFSGEYESKKHSKNHPMFGAPVKSFFKHILGINQEGSCKFAEVCIAPIIPTKLQRANASVKTASGMIQIAFEKNASDIDFNISIEDGVKATFRYKDTEKVLTTGQNKIRIAV